MKNLFVLGLWYGQEYSCQNHPLERNENVQATRSAQIQNRSRVACCCSPKNILLLLILSAFKEVLVATEASSRYKSYLPPKE